MHPTLKVVLVIVCSALVLSSCRKQKNIEYSLKGNIVDPNGNTPVSGVQVKLLVNKLDGGNFNSAFETIASTTTNANGDYTFTFNRENATAYKITYSRQFHFGSELEINPDDLNEEVDNIYNFDMPSMAWLRIHISNTNPFDANDEIDFQISDGAYNCGACCGTSIQTFTGMNVDTVVYCLNDGNHNVTGTGFYTKNGVGSTTSQTVYAEAYDTTDIIINY